MTSNAVIETESLREIPGPGWRVLLRIPELRRDPLGFFEALANENGGLTHVRLPGFNFILVTEPSFVQHVLQDNQRNYIKGDSVEPARVLVGNGLATSDGDLWLRQRRLMQPAFHRTRLANMSGLMVETGESFLAGMGEMPGADRSVDLGQALMQLTLQVIVRTMFSHDISDQAAELGQAFTEALRFIDRRSFGSRGAPLWLPTPANRRFKRSLERLDTIVLQIADARANRPDEYQDLLAMLLAARDLESGEGMSRNQLRDEIVTLFFAGHETTALTLTWAMVELLDSDRVAERLDDEIETVLGSRSPGFDDLGKLTFTRMVLDETLRLYPPAWIFARSSVEEDQLGGNRIPAGANILLSPYVTHRSQDYWPDPQRFDPERFGPDRGGPNHKLAYYPFGAGPRFCIGRDFALMEATLLLAMLRQRFDISKDRGFNVQAIPLVTLRPKGEVRVRLAPKQ